MREKVDKAERLHRLAEARGRQAELIARCQKLEQDLATLMMSAVNTTRRMPVAAGVGHGAVSPQSTSLYCPISSPIVTKQ